MKICTSIFVLTLNCIFSQTGTQNNNSENPLIFPLPLLFTPRLNCDFYGKFCGGFANIKCPIGYKCIDDPTDNCNTENGGADCGGICTKSGCPIKKHNCYVSCEIYCTDNRKKPRLCPAITLHYCFQYTKCDIQLNGRCGWILTPLYKKCMISSI